MINILHIISTLQQTGPVMVLYNILKYLDKSNFSAKIVTLSPEPSDTMWSKFEELGVSISSLKLSRLQGFFSGITRLQGVVSESNPNIVHLWGIRADLLAVQGLRRYKRVSSLQNYPLDDYVMTYGWLKGYSMAQIHFYALSQSHRIVACSTSVRKLVEANQKFSNTIIIPNAVDTSRFSSVTIKEKHKLREQLNLPIDKFVFISVGQLSTRKDPLTIIESFLTSTWDTRKPLLIFVGDGPLREVCMSRGERSDNLLFTGSIENVMDYLRAADYYISASTAEGLPNAVLEAIACGLPVCLSNIEPHKELLNLGGKIGVQFLAGNSQSLTAAIDTLLKVDKESMQQNALALVREKLNAQYMASQYEKLYSTLVNE